MYSEKWNNFFNVEDVPMILNKLKKCPVKRVYLEIFIFYHRERMSKFLQKSYYSLNGLTNTNET